MKWHTLFLGATALAVTTPVFAQGSGISDIIVTAQKREESLQKTPVSIAALTAADLQDNGIHDITDLRNQVPALHVTPHPDSGVTARIFIRGIGNNDNQITQDPSVAVYVDGVYVARSQGMVSEVANLERIEVLRGPQGSLYGRNAVGGAINFITAPPDLDDLHVQQDFALGNYSHFRSRTNVNIPIGDTLAVEAGYMYTKRHGFVKNPGTGSARFGDQKREAWRAAILWQPLDNLQFRYSYDRSDLDDTPVFMAAVPLYPQRTPRPHEASPYVQGLHPNDSVTQGHNLTATWDVLPSLTLKSITGYRKLHDRTNQNYLAGVFGPFSLLVNENSVKQKQFSEELQAIGNLGTSLEYVLGLYYFRETADGYDENRNNIFQELLERDTYIRNTAYAAYGQATWTPPVLGGRLHLTGGIRWSRDKRYARLQEHVTNPSGDTLSDPREASKAFNNVSPSVILGFDATPDVHLYAKWVRGYKTGGFNTRASSIDRFAAGFGPETLNSYEAGVKSMLFDNRLRLNASAFLSNYRDIQVNVRSDLNIINIVDVLNAGKARVKGVELDMLVEPTDGLSFSFSYAWMKGKYQKVLDITGADRAEFYRFINIPRHTINTRLEYRFPETPVGIPSASVGYYLQSMIYTSPSDPTMKMAGYGLLDARVSLSDIPVAGSKWRLSAFGRNLTDTEYYVTHFGAGVPVAIYGQPRTWGLELSFEY